MKAIDENVVIIYGQGKTYPEVTVLPIASWDVKQALKLVEGLSPRARPFAFAFELRAAAPDIDDGHGGLIRGARKQLRRSALCFLNGKVETLAEIEERADPEEGTLLSNMRSNSFTRVITTSNGWKNTQPFHDGATNLDADGNVLEVAP